MSFQALQPKFLTSNKASSLRTQCRRAWMSSENPTNKTSQNIILNLTIVAIITRKWLWRLPEQVARQLRVRENN